MLFRRIQSLPDLNYLHLRDVEAWVDAEDLELSVAVRAGRKVQVTAAQGPGFDPSPPVWNVENDDRFDVGEVDFFAVHVHVDNLEYTV